MRSFLAFEALTLLLCSILVLVLTQDQTAPTMLHHSTAIVRQPYATARSSQEYTTGREPEYGSEEALPEELLSIFWLRRVMTQPYSTWYLHDTATYDSVPVADRLPHVVVAQGQVPLPLHALYLWFCGFWVRWVRPQLAAELWKTQGPLHLSATMVKELRQTLSGVAVGCVVLMWAAPAAWCLSKRLSHLLGHAARERGAAASLHQNGRPPGVVAAPRCSVTRESHSATHQTDHRTHFVGAVLILVVGLLPLLAMEVCTMEPWCLCGAMMLWAVYAMLKDEVQLHPAEADICDTAFDLAHPFLRRGPLAFCSLKRPLRPLSLAGLFILATLLSLTLPACLFLTPLLFLWGFTSCWQHGYSRALVRMQAPSGAPDPTADADSFVRVGYSSYGDKSVTNAFLCYPLMFCVCVVLAITTPWWIHQQTLLTFMDLFAQPPLSPDTATQMVGVAAGRSRGTATMSLTGAFETDPRCLSGFHAPHVCARPVANWWQLTEWLGVPWTAALTAFTSILTDDATSTAMESELWLEYLTLLTIAMFDAAVIFALAFYRVSRPLLVFASPAEYLREMWSHEAPLVVKEVVQQPSARPRVDAGPPTLPAPSPATVESGTGAMPRKKIMTCLSREEYLVKQTVLLSWMLTVCAVSGSVFFRRSGPGSNVLVLVSCSLLVALYAMIFLSRRASAIVFDSVLRVGASGGWSGTVPSESHASTAGAQGGVARPAREPSAMMRCSGDDSDPPTASRWFATRGAPTLAHAADLPCLCAIVAASLLSTGTLTWMTVPPLLLYGTLAVLCGLLGFSLLRLPPRATLGVIGSVSVVLTGAGCLLLALLLTAQAVPPPWRKAYATGKVYAFVERVGSLYASSTEEVLRTCLHRCIVALVLYLSCILHASWRLVHLALEPEKTSFVSTGEQRSFYAPVAKQQRQKQQHAQKEKED